MSEVSRSSSEGESHSSLTTSGNTKFYAIAAKEVIWSIYENFKKFQSGEMPSGVCSVRIIEAVMAAINQFPGTTGRAEVTGALIGAGIGAGIGARIGRYLASDGGGLSSHIVGYCNNNESQRKDQAQVSHSLTSTISNLLEAQSLENAYSFLDLHETASVEEINKRYNELALQYRPDKGGDQENFAKLQTYVAIIKYEREENAQQ